MSLPQRDEHLGIQKGTYAEASRLLSSLSIASIMRLTARTQGLQEKSNSRPQSQQTR